MKIGVVAGEHSGDLLGSGLLKVLSQKNSNIEIAGIGGEKMLLQGCKALFPMEKLSVMGLIEPIKHLPELFYIRHKLYQHFIAMRPEVFVGIDSPDFNLGLEIKLKKAGIPVVHYVSPSVWAWRQKRIFKIAKAVDLMLTLLPFEADFYRQHDIPVHFVGHPLADKIPLYSDKKSARKKLGIPEEGIYIALLPGSRKQEIKYLGKIFLETANKCYQKDKHLNFLSSSIDQIRLNEFEDQKNQLGIQFPLHLFENRTHEVLAASDLVLVTSGTATLETMLYKRPMVIAYRMHHWTYRLARHLVKIPFFGLPNLLVNELLVPEFLQEEVTPDNLSNALFDFIDNPKKIEILEKKFLELHLMLKRNANEQAVKALLTILK